MGPFTTVHRSSLLHGQSYPILNYLTFMWTQKKKKKLIEKQIRFVVMEVGEGVEFNESGPKIQISSYKISTMFPQK